MTSHLDCPLPITIGDRCELTVELAPPPGAIAAVPEAPELGPFRVAGHRREADPQRGPRFERHVYTVHPFGTGELTLPPVKVAVQGPNAGTPPVLAATTPHRVTVTALLPPDAETPEALKGPVSLIVPRYGPALVLGGAVVLLIALAALLLRRRLAAGGPVGPQTAGELALHRLAALRSADLIAAGRAREHVTRLGWILREYIEARFQLARPPVEPGALQRTRRELLAGLRTRTAAAPYEPVLERVLGACDRVRFGRRAMAQAEADEQLAGAMAFVEATGTTGEDGAVSSAARRPPAGGGA